MTSDGLKFYFWRNDRYQGVVKSFSHFLIQIWADRDAIAKLTKNEATHNGNSKVLSRLIHPVIDSIGPGATQRGIIDQLINNLKSKYENIRIKPESDYVLISGLPGDKNTTTQHLNLDLIDLAKTKKFDIFRAKNKISKEQLVELIHANIRKLITEPGFMDAYTDWLKKNLKSSI